ncbi:zinc ribbon domain-containing protein [Pseudonocardia hierapolitana]|uniref:zinc ribbon domain-containing protein n=1 Tax=Pseudonocardia hierapolitana TaxID=1128676 RepID=UPI0011BF05E2
MSENAQTESGARFCPSCKEPVRDGATKCPHCQATIGRPPDHGGTCPICKENINPEAVRCRHCKSDLGRSPLIASTDFGGSSSVAVSAHPAAATGTRATTPGECSGCGGAGVAPSQGGYRIFRGPSSPLGTGSGGIAMRRYCFWFCIEECPAGPECCTLICVDLPDQGPAVAM